MNTKADPKEQHKERDKKIRQRNKKLRELAQAMSADEYWKVKDRV